MNLGTNFTIEFYMKPEQPVISSPIFRFEPDCQVSLAFVEDSPGNTALASTLDGPYSFPGTGTTGDRVIGGNSGTFRGWLDEFRISDEALTPDQFLNAVPEPGTWLLLLSGLGFVAGEKIRQPRCGGFRPL